MTTFRTSAAVAAVVCLVLAALSAGCGGSTGAQSAGSAASAASVSSASRPCQPDRPILYLGGAVRADGRQVKQASTKGAGNTWSSDGATQAYVSADAGRVILRTAAGSDRTLFVAPKHFAIVHRPAWSPDGARLALLLLDERGLGGGLGSYQPRLVVIDAQTGRPASDVALTPRIVNMPYITNPPDTVSFSPDGSRVAVSWDSLAVVDVAAGSVSQVWRSPAVAAWSPGGRLLFLAVENRARFGALYAWGPVRGRSRAHPGQGGGVQGYRRPARRRVRAAARVARRDADGDPHRVGFGHCDRRVPRGRGHPGRQGAELPGQRRDLGHGLVTVRRLSRRGRARRHAR